MEAAFFVMAIMGCGDAATTCATTRVEPAHYATVQQCQAAMPAALARNNDLDFPVVSAACQRNGVQMVERASGKARG
ncbi:hypothetical protein F4693_003083 [Sphingomonas endophytica]|uniref:Uncharacterized protein n=1 Tax=Sphingomonas endophytica TaxID=869719 RepID=A0A7X0MPD4_9SPHN|nr:hypothetical protein [Sphingomonas endophytica]MBB6506086.1 hypothetical protein [Sphingomonas endophytica]